LENTTEGDNMRLFKLIILLFILLLFTGTTSALIPTPTPIYDCMNILEPGEYKLNNSISVDHSTCIIISSDDVIVDGAGHTINGNPDYQYPDLTGVKVNGRYNVTVKNLKLTDLDFGIHYYNVSDGFIFNNDVSYISDTGILIDSSGYITLTNNFASNNYYAISLRKSFISILENNSASNSYWGFALYGSDSNRLMDNIALDNHYGICLESSTSNHLVGNIANSNNINGIYLTTSQSDMFEDNIVLDNSNWDFYSNVSSINSDWGFALYGSNSNGLMDNIALDNYCGICLESSYHNYLTGNIANSNNFSGIYLNTSQSNIFEDNTVLDNSNWDFYSDVNSINNDVINLNIGPTISFTSKDVSIKGSSSPANDPPGYRNINKYINATGNSQDSWLFMNVSYSDIDVEDVDENTLLMWKYNNIWSQVSGTNGVNTVQNYVFADIRSFSIFAPMADLPPANIANLQNITYAQNYINWTWTDPTDADFAKVMVYLDMVWVDNVSKDVQYYNATNLIPETTYTISTKTVDSEGNINQTFVSHTSTTAPPPDSEPPASVTNLKNVSYAQDYINWTWTDPNNLDFDRVMIYIDQVFKKNVSKGINYYQATGLTPETTYTISTQTVDSEGNINQTFVSNTSTTAPHPDTEPPASVTNLKNVSYTQDYINWTWTDPDNLDFDRVMIYIDQVFKKNVSKSINYYQATGLTPETAYTISTQTVDFEGNINQTFVSHTSTTAPHPDTEPPASVTNLKNVSYAQDYINWTWTDPNNLDFDRVMIYIDQVFKKNISKGINYYQATGLTPETTYAISTQTVDSEGNINQTFVSHTSTTAPIGPIIITMISPLNKSINTTGYVNVTAIFNRQGNATLNWNGVNESMEGSGTSFYKNNTEELLSGEFSFRIYASDSNSTSMSETRIVTVNRTEKELLYIDFETDKVNQTFEKVAPSRNVTLRIYNGTDVSGCIGKFNWIYVNSWAQLNSTLVENLDDTDKLLGENFSVEPNCYYFNPDAQIQFNYTDEQLKAKGISESDAFVKAFNATINKWEVPKFKQDTDLNHIIVNISHFSFYCLVGETPTIRPSSSSGGGGGSGGGTSKEAFENILISETIRENVFKESKVSYKFNKEGNIVRYINFTGLKNSGEIAIKVEILKNTSTLVENNLPQDVVYLNLNIWVGNLDWASSDNIANPKINFEVNKSWVLENRINVSTIRLFRYSDGNWNPLITTKIGEDANNLILEVETLEFSPFAVCGKTLAKAGGLGPDEDENEKITTSKESPDMTATTKKPIPGFKSSVGLVLLLMLIQILRKKKL
jgi:PGF-pre-PGF domain-containing protein